MADKPFLKDLCKANKGTLSYRKIAEISGVPENTVNNFFSSASKDPSVYTAGPICRVCEVSIDDYFGIVIPDKTPENERRIELLEHDNSALQRENEMLKESDARHGKESRSSDRTIFCLVIVLAMAVIALIPYIHMDINNPSFGLWRGSPTLIGAAIIIALSVGVGATVYLFVVSRKERRGK